MAIIRGITWEHSDVFMLLLHGSCKDSTDDCLHDNTDTLKHAGVFFENHHNRRDILTRQG